jgi:hypothetical protein
MSEKIHRERLRASAVDFRLMGELAMGGTFKEEIETPRVLVNLRRFK